MNIYLPTFVSGPIILILTFILCLTVVLTVKLLLSAINSFLESDKRKPQKTQVRETQPEKKPRPIRTVRSIEINPDDVDKIYVRKSS